jgi:hypothetical protein
MNRFVVTVAASASLALALSIAAAPLAAQDAGDATVRPRYAAGLAVGATQFDLSGTGTSAFGRAFAEMEIRRWLVGQASLGVMRPEEQSNTRNRYLIPEVQLQAQTQLGAFRPFLGVGGGWVLPRRGGRRQGTASGSGGVRFGIPTTALDGIAELRVRGIGRNFSGSTAEWTLGAAYRF